MAVEAQYPSNLVFLNRSSSEKENKRKKKEEEVAAAAVDYYSHQQHQPPLFFSTNGEPSHGGRDDNNNPRARGRDSRTPLRPPPSVSTGLRLSSRDLSAHTHQELDHFLLAQLRRTLAEKRQQHYRALLAAAEESAARRMREKQAELDRAAQGIAELEARLARVRTESMAWQAKAVADQAAAAASLHARLQRASSAPVRTVGPKPDERGESPAAEDAESACADPFRSGFCRSCRASPVSVVLLPCRHLCLCAGCDAVTAGECCPVCGSARTGSVPVFL